MANIDQQAVHLLESLPPKHRAHLICKHAEHFSARASVREKLEIIARRLGPRDIMPYQMLYFDHNPRLFVWYLNSEDTTQLPTFYNGVVRRYGAEVRTGLEPALEEDGPAELHRLLDRQRTLVLEFGIRDRTKLVFHAWREKRYRQDSIYRVVVNAEPLMLEVRATGGETQNKLVVATGKALGRMLDQVVRCDLSPAEKYDALQNRLSARFIGVVHAATGQGLSRSSLDADEVTSLETTTDYIAQSAHPYRTESARKYEFFFLHHDSYSEKIRYEVSLLSGDIRLSYQVSEKAIEAIRAKVVEIFDAP